MGPGIFPIPDIYFTFLFPSFPCDLLWYRRLQLWQHQNVGPAVFLLCPLALWGPPTQMDWERRGKSGTAGLNRTHWPRGTDSADVKPGLRRLTWWSLVLKQSIDNVISFHLTHRPKKLTLKGYKQYWCTFKDTSISCYKSKEESSGTPAHQMNLRGKPWHDHCWWRISVPGSPCSCAPPGGRFWSVRELVIPISPAQTLWVAFYMHMYYM